MEQNSEDTIVFGTWVQQQRERENLTIAKLAENSMVDAGTISRIENDRIQTTLQTAIFISGGLGVPLIEFADAWKRERSESAIAIVAKPDETRSTAPIPQIKTLLSPQDVLDFVLLDQISKVRARFLLSELVREILHYTEFKEQQATVNEQLVLSMLESLHLPDSIAMFRVEMLFPPGLETETIWETYKFGGKLTQADIAKYIDKRRPLWIKHKQLSQSDKNLLSRLKSGGIDRIKLMEVAKLDIRLQEDLVGMSWNAHKSKSEWIPTGEFDSYNETNLHYCIWPLRTAWLVSTFVTVCWWRFLVQQGIDDNWLEELRASIRPDSQENIVFKDFPG